MCQDVYGGGEELVVVLLWGVMDSVGERFVWGLGVGENFAKGKWAEWTE